ncbi:MAG: alpha-amylase family glycosyl hydrolase, partial [Cyanobacteria bacterium J06558_2]
QEIRQIIDQYQDRVLIGETFIDSDLYESAVFYGINNDELHLPLTFEFPFSPWYPGYLQRQIAKNELITPKGAWASYFLDNHDVPRHLSRWVECSLCTNQLGIAQAAAAILLTVRGTPILYYGQEIGMVDNVEIPPEKIQDKIVVRSDTDDDPESRDGARTPMQWDTQSNAGFSGGKSVEPWLPVNQNYQSVNVAQELKDPDSILNFYRQLIKVRRNSKALLRGTWRTLIHYPYEHLAYVRETEQEQVLILINFSYEQNLQLDEDIEGDNWQVLVSNFRKTNQVIALPQTLEAFEVSIMKKQ